MSLRPVPADARQAAAGEARESMSIEEYEPHSTLRVPETPLTRARFPFIDVHGHQGGVRFPDHVERLVGEMDELNMAVMVSLSGGSGERPVHNRERASGHSVTRPRAFPGRGRLAPKPPRR